MRCIECHRDVSALADGLCPTCAVRAEREVAEFVGEPPTVTHCHVGNKAMDIKGLPGRTPIEDTSSGHADPAVPGAILSAPDAQHEFTIRHAGGG